MRKENSRDWQLQWHPPSCRAWMVTVHRFPKVQLSPDPRCHCETRPVPKDQSSTPRLPEQASGSYPFRTLLSKSPKLKSQVSPRTLPSKATEKQAVWKLMPHWWRAIFIAGFWSLDSTDRRGELSERCFKSLISKQPSSRRQNTLAMCTQSSAKLR